MSIVSDIAWFLASDRFYPGWTQEALEDYVVFQMKQQTLVVAVRDNKVTGCLIGWQQARPEHIPFNWQRTDPLGSWWWWDQYKANDHESALVIGRSFIQSQPVCLGLPSVGLRHGHLKIYPPGMALRSFLKGTKIYGHKSENA